MDRLIRVTGKGKKSVKPDKIELHIDSEGVFKEYTEAVKKSAENTGLICDAIEKAGFDSKNLKTISFAIKTEYDSYQDKSYNWKKKFKGYMYQHFMHIDFPNDNDILGRALYELSKCPAKAELSIYYTVNDPDLVKDELLKKAVADSKSKALALTEAAGVSLGDIVNIDYSWGELDIYSDRWAMGAACEESERGYICGSSLDLNMVADDIDVEDTVTVVWGIKE